MGRKGCTVKPVLSGHSKYTPKIGFQYQLSLNAGQKYCRMLPLEHSAILSTFIKKPFTTKTFGFFLSIFKLLLKICFTVQVLLRGPRQGLESLGLDILYQGKSCIHRGSNMSARFIEFNKQIEKKRKNVKLVKHFITFLQQVC